MTWTQRPMLDCEMGSSTTVYFTLHCTLFSQCSHWLSRNVLTNIRGSKKRSKGYKENKKMKGAESNGNIFGQIKCDEGGEPDRRCGGLSFKARVNVSMSWMGRWHWIWKWLNWGWMNECEEQNQSATLSAQLFNLAYVNAARWHNAVEILCVSKCVLFSLLA